MRATVTRPACHAWAARRGAHAAGATDPATGLTEDHVDELVARARATSS
ncbi:MAG: hypothetical protein MSC31_18055 [Solirubrobacteraceae bacterium MAG38_C4-C5]|nr:hypothetical protein [Candidatus Siliceabacter maunaloa]